MSASRRMAAAATAVGAAGLAAAHIVVLAQGVTRVRLWEDEAYNLTVPLNLVAGLGYSSNGILTTGTLDPFDVRISTGPLVLLPTAGLIAVGVEPVGAGRLVGAAFWLLLIAVLAFHGFRRVGPVGALLGAAAPLLLDSLRYPSPLQAPTDILGEVPAAAFLAIAVTRIARNPVMSAIALGLAVQSKTLAVVAAPVLLLVAVVAAPPGWVSRLRRGAVFSAVAAAPTALFEAVKLVSLGPVGYIDSTRNLYYFLRSGGQAGYDVAPIDKILYLGNTWFVPWPVVVIVLVAGVALLAWALRGALGPKGSRRGLRLAADAWPVVVAAVVVLVVWLGWWSLSRGQPLWIRHPSPALLSCVPILLMEATRSARRLLSSRARVARSIRPFFAVAAAVALTTGVAGRVAAGVPTGETLADQRADAAAVSALAGDELRGEWGVLPVVAVLAGKHAVLLSNDEDSTSPILIERWSAQAQLLLDERCGPLLVQRAGFVVCTPR